MLIPIIFGVSIQIHCHCALIGAASAGLTSKHARPELTAGSRTAADALSGARGSRAAIVSAPIRGRLRAAVRAHLERTGCQSGGRCVVVAAHSARRRAPAARRGGAQSGGR